MKTAIMFDCEWLCVHGSPGRFWCAAYDPDPVVAQIGAVKLGLEEDFPLLDTYRPTFSRSIKSAIGTQSIRSSQD